MLEKIQSVIAFLLKYKNVITNAVGFVFALAVWLNEFLLTNSKPNVLNLITSLVVWCVAYFTGKSPLK